MTPEEIVRAIATLEERTTSLEKQLDKSTSATDKQFRELKTEMDMRFEAIDKQFTKVSDELAKNSSDIKIGFAGITSSIKEVETQIHHEKDKLAFGWKVLTIISVVAIAGGQFIIFAATKLGLFH